MHSTHKQTKTTMHTKHRARYYPLDLIRLRLGRFLLRLDLLELLPLPDSPITPAKLSLVVEEETLKTGDIKEQ